jgi:tricorn protease
MIHTSSIFRLALQALRTLFTTGVLVASALQAETRLLRFPDLHGNTVAFTYGGDIWTAPAGGGVAVRLTAHPGLELFPKFSPDGKWIAFTGQYDGDEQVYVIPSGGGVPRQLTFYPAFGPLNPWAGYDNQVMGWTPDGASVLFRSMRDADGVLSEGTLYTVKLEGGPSLKLPVTDAGAGALSLDGKQLAYEPIFRDISNWKRYQGGRARGLYVLDLATSAQKRVAPSQRTERDPMWIGGQLCFTSDRDGTLNLYSVDPATNRVRQLTNAITWDVRWPSTDHVSRIVYEKTGGLRILDVNTGSDLPIPITVPTDGGASRPTRVEAEVQEWGLSPKGERALFVARGDVFTAPIENGAVRNLTHSSSAHDKLARWSPDGRTIAFVSDLSGEEQVYLVDQEGKGKPEALTTTLKVFIRSLTWAPDGRHLALGDKDGRIFVLGVEDHRLVLVAKDTEDGDVDCAWSPDGQYLAITLSNRNGFDVLNLWSAADGRLRPITSGYFTVRYPAWDPQGRYLYYLSRRDYNSHRSNLEADFAGGANWGVFAMALRRDVPHPFPPESDEVTLAPKVPTAAPAEPGPLRIDWEGLEQRVVRVPVAAGHLSQLDVVPGALLFQRERRNARARDPKASLCLFDLGKRQETVLAEDTTGHEVSADGSRVLLRKDGAFSLMETRGGAHDRKVVATRDLMADVVPAEEWAQVFEEVWRRYRDFFYVKNMHGVDWKAIGDQYRPLLKHVTHRSDLTYVLAEMVGELNVGHAYLGGGDYFQPERPKVGLPGAQLEVDPWSGRYRLTRIFQGHNEEPQYRSPLTEVGVDARVGDYVLAIDGQELKGTDDPYRLLRNKTHAVTLTLNAKPVLDGARQVTYTPIETEVPLRYLDFVLRSLTRVEVLGRGQVGYLHLPDMSDEGLAAFIKWYYPQIRKKALVVDVRANGGGSISQMILERLGRKLLGLDFGVISEFPATYPDTVLHGPMVCLLSETTSSDGEIFAHHFRKMGLGPLVGKRTWGGVVGYEDTGPLLDGSFVWVPMVGTAGPDGQWIIEGEGVHPDLDVDNDPKALGEGRDPQLEAAVAVVLRRLAEHPMDLPGKPADPVKAK